MKISKYYKDRVSFEIERFNFWSSRDKEDMAIPFPKSQMRSPYSLKYNDSLLKANKKSSVLSKRI